MDDFSSVDAGSHLVTQSTSAGSTSSTDAYKAGDIVKADDGTFFRATKDRTEPGAENWSNYDTSTGLTMPYRPMDGQEIFHLSYLKAGESTNPPMRTVQMNMGVPQIRHCITQQTDGMIHSHLLLGKMEPQSLKTTIIDLRQVVGTKLMIFLPPYPIIREKL